MPRTGTGRIYQRGETWWIDYQHKGKRFRESSESTKKVVATNLLKKRLGEIGAGRHVGRTEEKLTLADLKKITVDDYKQNRLRSLDRLDVSWIALEAHFSLDFRVVDLKTTTIKAYIAARQDQGRADNTIRNEIAALRRGLRLAHQAELITKIPHIPMPPEGPVREGILTRGDLDALLLELPDYLRPVTLFAYLTGWRRGEVLSLTWRQVDFDGGELRLLAANSKNKKSRSMPFRALPELDALLQDQHERTRALEKETGAIIPWVFHRDGDRIKSLKTAWAGACRRAGLEGTIFHDLRRCAVTNLEAAGVPRSVAMSFSGHRTESVYKRYAIVKPDEQKRGMEKLASYFEEQGGGDRKVVPLRKVAEK